MFYTPHTAKDQEKMLARLGVKSIKDLYDTIPQEVFLTDWEFPSGLGEAKTYRYLKELADKNRELTTFIGLGLYDHEIPSAVWALAGKAEFVTAYTPYQAEASQGMLQVIFEFQSMIAELTSMDTANASLYDGATALAEAMLMAVLEKKQKKVAVSLGVNPLYREVLKTYAKAIGIEIKWLPLNEGQTVFKKDDVAAYILQQPNFLGYVEATESFREIKNQTNALGIVSINPVLASVLRKPSAYDADIVCGEGQALGIPMNSGGPLLGFIATKKSLTRKLPGRIVGLTTDRNGKDAFVLTLQAREQHIRREKAGSNICTNQALNALAATIYLALLGKEGLKEVALGAISNTHYLADRLKAIGVKVGDKRPFLMEFPVLLEPKKAHKLKEALLIKGFTPPISLGEFDRNFSDHYLLCATEKRYKQEIDAFVSVWEGIL